MFYICMEESAELFMHIIEQKKSYVNLKGSHGETFYEAYGMAL